MIEAPAILVVEDNPADVRLIEEGLRGINPAPRIVVACNGDEALDLLAQGEMAPLLFLDFHLPKTDSREVLKRIRTDERWSETAIVVFSTSEITDLIREAYRLGADCFLSKPSDLDDFLRTIRCAARYWLGLHAQNKSVCARKYNA